MSDLSLHTKTGSLSIHLFILKPVLYQYLFQNKTMLTFKCKYCIMSFLSTQYLWEKILSLFYIVSETKKLDCKIYLMIENHNPNIKVTNSITYIIQQHSVLVQSNMYIYLLYQ